MDVRVINHDESIIYQNNIYRYGSEIKGMNDAVAESLIKRGYVEDVSVKKPVETEAEEEMETTAVDIQETEESLTFEEVHGDKSYQELKKLASEVGVDASGRKEDLFTRLKEWFESSDQKDDFDETPNTSMPEE